MNRDKLVLSFALNYEREYKCYEIVKFREWLDLHKAKGHDRLLSKRWEFQCIQPNVLSFGNEFGSLFHDLEIFGSDSFPRAIILNIESTRNDSPCRRFLSEKSPGLKERLSSQIVGCHQKPTYLAVIWIFGYMSCHWVDVLETEFY